MKARRVVGEFRGLSADMKALVKKCAYRIAGAP
jgi:hypothetical protein